MVNLFKNCASDNCSVLRSKERFECNCIAIMDNKQVTFFTACDVNVNEELCWDYGSDYWRGREDKV